ncbi:YdcF family protein [Xanthobacter sediminis]
MAKAAVLLAGGGILAVLVGFLVFLTQIAIREPVQVRPADAIVVLTGGASRIADAVNLLAEGRGRRLLITGVNPVTSRGELGRILPDGEALISCCVDLGRKALNTRGNAIEAAEWTRSQNFRSLVVVTSAWHMPRALVELGRSLPDVDLVAYPVVTSRMEAERWWRDPATVKLLFKEYLKYMMAKAQIRPVQAVTEADAPPAPAPAEARIAQ